MRIIENILGVAAVSSAVLSAYAAYENGLVLTDFWLYLSFAVGLSWLMIYLFNLVNWFLKGVLFFTKSLRFFNLLLFIGIAAYLIYLNLNYSPPLLLNLRYALAFWFFLIGVANIRNFIHLEGEERVHIAYQRVSLRWSEIQQVEIARNGYLISLKNSNKYIILLEHLFEQQQQPFKEKFDKMIEAHQLDFEIEHLIGD